MTWPPDADFPEVQVQGIIRKRDPMPPARLGSPGLPAKPLARKKRRIVAAVAACLLLAGQVGLWAGGVIKVKTKDGGRSLQPWAEELVARGLPWSA